VKLLKLILICPLFSNCGYLPDGSELVIKNHVVGNIYVQQAKMDVRPSLAFELDPQHTSILVNESITVTYDTLNKRIFVEGHINEWNSDYYQISVLDTVTTVSSKAYKMYKLERKRYFFLISDVIPARLLKQRRQNR
jgi:hypothetical protein